MFSTRAYVFYILVSIALIAPCIELVAQENIVDTSNYSALFQDDLDYYLLIAASEGDDLVIDKLLKAGADIDAISGSGATPLVFAVAGEHLSTVRNLISQGSDVNKLTFNHEAPLIISVKNQNIEITEVLIRAEADIESADRFGATALYYASLYGNFYIADLLLYYEAECDNKSEDGTTPLMAAIWTGNADIADLLVQNGANMEATDKQGFTPFLIASQLGDTLMMNYLLKKGVNIYEKNNSNYNALDLAIAFDHKQAADLLLKKGDKWSMPDISGINPYRVATDFNRKNLLKVLESNKFPDKPGRHFTEKDICINGKFTFRDIYTGIGLTIKEPVLNGGFIAGCDLKLWYTRVLVKTGENEYYQYFDKSSVVYAGVFKDFILNNNQAWMNLSFSTSIAGAYSFGHRLKGTNLTPGNKFKILPYAGVKIQKNYMLFSAGLEYMKSEFYRIGTIWFRAGFSYCLFPENRRYPGKTIKWH